MCARPDRDRLAVWTYEEAGEQVPTGDPRVTDAERAAAYRETLAERFAALLPGNQSRAAAQYEAGGLPDGQDMARVWRPREEADLRAASAHVVRARLGLTGPEAAGAAG